MSVILETTLGELVVDLETVRCPNATKNFIKLCKIKYYNYCPILKIQKDFTLQTGDPSGSGAGGESIWGIVKGKDFRYFTPEVHPRLKHKRIGTLSLASVSAGDKLLAGSQFFITLGPDLGYLDKKHAVIGHVEEGIDVLKKFNVEITDDDSRPFQDIRITHTIVIDDPFDDIPGLRIPNESPEPPEEMFKTDRLRAEELDEPEFPPEELEKLQRHKEAAARALTLEMVGDLPFAGIRPPENVLFVCKLNAITRDEDLELIFCRFGKILSCEIIRDKATDESLCYAFIEFDKKEDAEEAYLKMDGKLIDGRRIKVDFSQSVSKLHWEWTAARTKSFPLRGEAGERLERRSRYRDQKPDEGNRDRYGMVFDHLAAEGEIRGETQREGSRRRRRASPDSGRRRRDSDSRSRGRSWSRSRSRSHSRSRGRSRSRSRSHSRSRALTRRSSQRLHRTERSRTQRGHSHRSNRSPSPTSGHRERDSNGQRRIGERERRSRRWEG